MRDEQAVVRDPGVVHEHGDRTERRSRRPRTPRRPSFASLTSARTANALPPAARRPRRVSVGAVGVGSRSRTRPGARRAASATTIARPMPRERAGDERDTRGRRVAVTARAPAQRARWPRSCPAPKPEHSTRSPSATLAVVDRLEQRERDRRRRRVAVAVDVHERAVRRDAEPVGGGVDDADVGLVRDEPVDVVGVDAGPFERGGGWSRRRRARPAGTPPGPASSGSARVGDGLGGGRPAAAAGRDLEQPGGRAVAAEVPREQAGASLAVRASTAAPAPSPNRTQVARSSGSMMRVSVSAPTMSTCS